MHASGALIRWPLDNQLVDEISLFVCLWSSARAHGCSPTPARTQHLARQRAASIDQASDAQTGDSLIVICRCAVVRRVVAR